MHNTHHVISQFADDTLLFLAYEENTLCETINTLAHVEEHTGLKILYDKTTIYRVGSIKNTNAKFITGRNLCWSDDDIETLGVSITNGVTQKTSVYDKCIDKLEAVADTWYHRQFSLAGKVLIVNTLMGSIFVYKMTVFPDLSSKQLERINGVIRRFLWNGKKEKNTTGSVTGRSCTSRATFSEL